MFVDQAVEPGRVEPGTGLADDVHTALAIAPETSVLLVVTGDADPDALAAARVATMMGADLLVLLSDIDGLYFNGGWCYGGFKATPASGWCFAHLLAKDAPHETATAYRFDRFRKGLMIDEKGQGAQPNLH